MFKEFRQFINRGNVIDLSVAVVMGAAFGAIVTSLVNDIVTPTIGLLTRRFNFSGLSLWIGSTQIPYGNFVQAVLSFLLIAWVTFWLVRMVNHMQEQILHEKTAEPVKAQTDNQLLTEIRDLLATRLPSATNPSTTESPAPERHPANSF